MARDPKAVEANLTRYYDGEGEARSGRPLDPRRIAARDQFLTRIGDAARRVLEIGSGPGRDAPAFIHAGHDYTAMDLSIEHLRRCNTTGAKVIRATTRLIPVRSGAFDAVWTMSTLMHVPNSAIEASLVEIARVLRSGGLAAIGVWGGPNVEDDSVDDPSSGQPPRLFSRRSAERWRELLSAIGRVEAFETWGDDPEFGYQWSVIKRP